MRVLWLLNELGVPHEVVCHPFDKSLRSPDYLTVHPVGRVPSIELDGDVIWESGAIIQVLCQRYSPNGLGRTPDDPDWADWLIWLHFAETISQHSAALTQQHIALYDDAMRSPVVMRLEARRLEKCYGALEARLSAPAGTRDTLLASGFTAADIAVGQAVYMARHFAPIEPFEALAHWYGRITARPAFRGAVPPKGAALLYERAFYPAWDGAAG